MNIPRAGGSARRLGRAHGTRTRFKEAVPLRGDRRDLRRQFRRAARAALTERKAEMTVLLQRLSSHRVPLEEVLPGPRARDAVVVFLDGTRLLLVARHRSAGVQRLRERHRRSSVPLWLVRAQPSFATCLFRLWFAPAGSTQPSEVLANVGPAPEGT